MVLGIVLELIKIAFYVIYVHLEFLFRCFVPPNPKSIKNEIILVTGSAVGIGREICLKLARGGPIIICMDIQKKENDKLVADLRYLGVQAFSYLVDVSNRTEVEMAIQKIQTEVGDISVVVNNAGIMPCHEFLSHSPKEIERVFQVNLLSQFWILRSTLPTMLLNGHGHIITLSSAAGILPTRNLVPYVSSKWGVSGLVAGLREELRHTKGGDKIKFTTAFPFSTRTNLLQNVNYYTRFPSIVPILEPDEVAGKIVDGFLRNYEEVYIPGTIRTLAFIYRALLEKVSIAGFDFFNGYVEPQKNSTS